MITYLLLAVYVVVFTWWLRRDRFILGAGFNKLTVMILFWLKILLAWLYGWVGGPLYQYKFDTWIVHQHSLKETNLLRTDFMGFIADIFSNPYYQENLLIKLTAVWNLFSNGSYCINAVFFSFFTFYGMIAFVRLYQLILPGSSNWLLYAFILLPSFLFWSNGMYKDGWIFTGINLAAYGVYTAEKHPRNYLLALAGAVMLLVFRTYVGLVVIPCLFYYSVARKWRFQYFTTGLIGIIVAIAAAMSWLKVVSIPQVLSTKRAAFLELTGSSLLDSAPLPPDWAGFWSFLPASLNHLFLRPFPWEAVSQLFYIPEAVQTMLVIALMIIWCLRRGWKIDLHPMAKLLVVIAFINFLIIGFTVPFLGAIVRYKSIYLPFIVMPLVYGIKSMYFNINSKQ